MGVEVSGVKEARLGPIVHWFYQVATEESLNACKCRAPRLHCGDEQGQLWDGSEKELKRVLRSGDRLGSCHSNLLSGHPHLAAVVGDCSSGSHGWTLTGCSSSVQVRCQAGRSWWWEEPWPLPGRSPEVWGGKRQMNQTIREWDGVIFSLLSFWLRWGFVARRLFSSRGEGTTLGAVGRLLVALASLFAAHRLPRMPALVVPRLLQHRLSMWRTSLVAPRHVRFSWTWDRNLCLLPLQVNSLALRPTCQILVGKWRRKTWRKSKGWGVNTRKVITWGERDEKVRDTGDKGVEEYRRAELENGRMELAIDC